MFIFFLFFFLDFGFFFLFALFFFVKPYILCAVGLINQMQLYMSPIATLT
jgi:hypothetical protein